MKHALIKIGPSGEQLPSDAKTFLATLNTRTNLMAAVNAVTGEVNFAEAESAIAAMNADSYAGFNEWRLPSVQELFSLVDNSRHSPAANPGFYPDTKSDRYWTSTPVAWSSVRAWIVDFNDGGVSSGNRNGTAFVRPVRAIAGDSAEYVKFALNEAADYEESPRIKP